MPEAKLALGIPDFIYFFWPRDIGNMFGYKACVVLLLIEQSAEVHQMPSAKHAIMVKKNKHLSACIHYLRNMSLIIFNHGRNSHYPKICVWWLC